MYNIVVEKIAIIDCRMWDANNSERVKLETYPSIRIDFQLTSFKRDAINFILNFINGNEY